MKKLYSLVLIGMLAISGVLRADTAVATITATNAVVLDGAYVLTSIQVLQATNGIVRLYDDNDKALTNVTVANVQVRSYVTNLVEEWVAPLGTTNLLTNTVVWYYTVTNAQTTNARSAFLSVVGSTTTPVVRTINRTLQRGLVVSNATSGDIIVEYQLP